MINIVFAHNQLLKTPAIGAQNTNVCAFKPKLIILSYGHLWYIVMSTFIYHSYKICLQTHYVNGRMLTVLHSYNV